MKPLFFAVMILLGTPLIAPLAQASDDFDRYEREDIGFFLKCGNELISSPRYHWRKIGWELHAYPPTYLGVYQWAQKLVGDREYELSRSLRDAYTMPNTGITWRSDYEFVLENFGLPSTIDSCQVMPLWAKVRVNNGNGMRDVIFGDQRVLDQAEPIDLFLSLLPAAQRVSKSPLAVYLRGPDRKMFREYWELMFQKNRDLVPTVQKGEVSDCAAVTAEKDDSVFHCKKFRTDLNVFRIGGEVPEGTLEGDFFFRGDGSLQGFSPCAVARGAGDYYWNGVKMEAYSPEDYPTYWRAFSFSEACNERVEFANGKLFSLPGQVLQAAATSSGSDLYTVYVDPDAEGADHDSEWLYPFKGNYDDRMPDAHVNGLVGMRGSRAFSGLLVKSRDDTKSFPAAKMPCAGYPIVLENGRIKFAAFQASGKVKAYSCKGKIEFREFDEAGKILHSAPIGSDHPKLRAFATEASDTKTQNGSYGVRAIFSRDRHGGGNSCVMKYPYGGVRVGADCIAYTIELPWSDE